MRTALRTSIVTAALAGALLAPAATALAAPTAPAAQAAQAVTSTSTVTAVSAASGNTSGVDRYDGEKHLVAKGRLAVLRNGAEGPEVWIRAVGPDWKPGDGWAGRVLAKLDPAHKRAVIDGIRYDLKKITSGPHEGRYGLGVRVLGGGTADGWYILPKAAKPTPQATTKPSAKPTTKPAVKPASVTPQTVVVPRGPVAAGAEITGAASADTGDTTSTAAAGAALIAILAAVGTAFMVRARKARARG
ncbi:hypothetical protein OG730_21200 [Streptomyces sp. NBC_01298]|uniref:hypothetical protein n=1 Tax=Streptomyces sp. NBC_01298 TaxID=2903817 RepID=UPI002E11D955|nr:hypothetical protein OG730_21200 [Streptomyces sp. NBC_01298]